MTPEREPFIVEATTVEAANRIDTDKYRLSEKLSEHGWYVFLRRGGR
jgi:hypothetical protein